MSPAHIEARFGSHHFRKGEGRSIHCGLAPREAGIPYANSDNGYYSSGDDCNSGCYCNNGRYCNNCNGGGGNNMQK